MNRFAVIALVVLAGLALAVWLLWPGLISCRDDAGTGGSAPATRPSDPDLPSSRGAALAGADPIKPRAYAEPATEDGPKPFTIAGKVVDADERPLPRVKVKLQLYDGYEAKGDPILEQMATADGEAAFAFTFARPRKPATWSAGVSEDDLMGFRETQEVVPGDPTPAPIVLRAWRYDADVAGTVSDKDGSKIADATVGWGREVKTGKDGSYRFRISTRSSAVWLSARAPGFARKEAQLAAPAAGSTTRMDFVLDPEGVLTGTVRARAGPPVADARVYAWTSDNVEARTDATGAFRLAGFDTTRDFQLINVEAAGFQPAFIQRANFVANQANVEIFLDPGIELPGVVLGREDLPVEGAEVRIGKPRYVGTVTVRTDAQGRFVFKGAKPGPSEIAANRRGYSETTVTVTVPEVGQTAPEVRIRLEPSRQVGGIVTDAAQTPVRAITVSAKFRGEYVDKSARCDADGRFVIDDVPASELSLELYGKGWLRKTVEVPQPRTDLAIVVQRAARLAGRVVDFRSKTPIDRFRIRILPPDLLAGEHGGYGYSTTWSERGHVFANSDGYWTVDEDLAPGAVFGIEASADGYAAARAKRVVAKVDAPKDGVVLELGAAATISGVVVLEGSGAPVPDALVFVTTVDEERTRAIDRRWSPLVKTRTNAGGAFTVTGVPPGDVHVVAQPADYPQAVVGPMAIAEGQQLDGVKVAVQAGATVEGTCLGADLKPLAGAAIQADASGMSTARVTTTDAKGRFTIGGLPAGFVYVSATMGTEFFNRLTVPVTVAANETKTVTLAMDGPCTLRVDVDCDEAFPAEAALILRPEADPGSKPDGRPHREMPITAQGLEVTGLGTGRYSVTVANFSMDGRALGGSGSVTLEAGKRSEIRIKLKRGG